MKESFENLVIDLDQLPTLQEEDYSNIEPAYKKATLLSWGILFMILLIGPPIGIYFGDDAGQGPLTYLIAIGSVLFLWIINFIWVNKAFKKKKYSLRQKDLIYCKGLLWTKRTTIPFNRIQHAEVKQGPIERVFKLHNLKVFTAGGSSSDLSIPGLTEDKAGKLKEFILNKIEEDDGEHSA